MESENQAPKPEANPEQAKPAKPAAAKAGKIAVIRLRNLTGASGAVKDTLKMLGLYKKFTCVVVPGGPCQMGMLDKVKDYATYGEIDAETLKALKDKRGVKDKDGKLKKHFHLHPPRGGLERKGIKHSFNQGGALGYRGSNINQMIKKML